MELTELTLLTTPVDPGDYFHAGHKVPVHLTAKQKVYCRRAVGAACFTYNLFVETHRFHRTNRLKWPTISQMANCITQMKKEEFSFISEISFRVTDGAIDNFKNALNKWLDPDDPAQKPSIHRRKRTGTGTFRAAGAVREIHYNGKRRIKLPYLGSVKLNHTLPKGVIHEAHISRENDKWMLSINYRKDPIPKPQPDNRIEKGAADSGISPSATDSEGQVWLNPKAFYQAERKLARWQRTQARRKPGSRGWWEAQRKIDKLQRRVKNIRSNAIHQMTKDLVTKFQNLVIEDLNVAAMMKGITPQGPGRRRHGRDQKTTLLQGPVAPLPGIPGQPLLPIQQDLLFLPGCQLETQEGNLLAMPQLWDGTRKESQRSRQPAKPVGPPALSGRHAPRREGSGPRSQGRGRNQPGNPDQGSGRPENCTALPESNADCGQIEGFTYYPLEAGLAVRKAKASSPRHESGREAQQ